jgi:hypothetical protein
MTPGEQQLDLDELASSPARHARRPSARSPPACARTSPSAAIAPTRSPPRSSTTSPPSAPAPRMTDPALLEGMNWRQWEAHVQGLLRFYGWRHFHAPANLPRDGRRGGGKQHVEPGFPDLVAIRRLRGYGPELVFAELKTGTGRLTRAQREWRDDLEAYVAGVRAAGKIAATAVPVHELPAIAYYVWRPADVADVERTLAGPHGLNVPVDRVAELAGGDVVGQDPSSATAAAPSSRPPAASCRCSDAPSAAASSRPPRYPRRARWALERPRPAQSGPRKVCVVLAHPQARGPADGLTPSASPCPDNVLRLTRNPCNINKGSVRPAAYSLRCV